MDGGGVGKGDREQVPCEPPMMMAVVSSKSVSVSSSDQRLLDVHALPFQR